jgi:DNA-binding FadR family transcriptional regulator
MSYFGLDRDQACSIAESYRLKSLFEIREAIAESLFELAAYDNPEQDLAALYRRIYAEHLGPICTQAV